MSDIATTNLPEPLYIVCKQLAQAGGHAWLVGGCVRDMILGTTPMDFDLEVYGLPADTLQQTLSKLGHTAHVGRHFGVSKLWLNGLEIDIALPRSEKKSGHGHAGFAISTDPDLAPERASLRRDFSINAMMLDPLTGTLLDYHQGQDDLQRRILRHVSPAFSEDPLRPLRAMQFAARFRLQLHRDTAQLCRRMLGEAASLPAARIWAEWRKWCHSAAPSYGLQALNDSGWLSLYPELLALIGCPQSPHWHPEGDVWTHSLLVCDQAARIATTNHLDSEQREYLLLASLCHDLGKPGCTISSATGQISSPDHSEAGMLPAKMLMQKIATPGHHPDYILPLVRDHITHLHGTPTPRAVRRLAHRLQPASIELWEMLVEADASGRAPAPPSRPAYAWLKLAQAEKHHRTAPQAIVNGKLLLQMGLSPGTRMGSIIKQAYTAQLDGCFADENGARQWLQQRLAKEC